MCGPVIQPDLFTIVVNFRTYQFVLIGDLTKMYRSVRLHPDDFKHQQILWRSDPNELLKSFSLTTLTYGLKPSSFIATRCSQELSNQNDKSFPKESEIIRKHFYACMHACILYDAVADLSCAVCNQILHDNEDSIQCSGVCDISVHPNCS
jgi:hypothetical protein